MYHHKKVTQQVYNIKDNKTVRELHKNFINIVTAKN